MAADSVLCYFCLPGQAKGLLVVCHVHPSLSMEKKLMRKQRQAVTPLLDIRDPQFAHWYELGMFWSLYGDEQDEKPLPIRYFVTTLKQDEERGTFTQEYTPWCAHMGFYLGMYHSRVFVKEKYTLRPDATTLITIDNVICLISRRNSARK